MPVSRETNHIWCQTENSTIGNATVCGMNHFEAKEGDRSHHNLPLEYSQSEYRWFSTPGAKKGPILRKNTQLIQREIGPLFGVEMTVNDWPLVI